MKKIFVVLLMATVAASLVFAGGASDNSGKQVVGVLMPTQSSERWINDGGNMKKMLESKGYAVELQCAEDDVQMQVSQLENMIASGVDCLVIASIDSTALVNGLATAKQNNIPVIAYDRLLMDTDAVSYYATFDNKGVGTAIGKYIEEKKGLATAAAEGRSYTIEFFMGSPDDNNALFLYNGCMEVLKPVLTMVFSAAKRDAPLSRTPAFCAGPRKQPSSGAKTIWQDFTLTKNLT